MARIEMQNHESQSAVGRQEPKKRFRASMLPADAPIPTTG
jgi:hypothetical protein